MAMRRRLAAVVLAATALSGCAGTPAPEAPIGQITPGARAGEPTEPARAFTARVERVVDGDTFIAVVRGQRLRVRLIGVDTPETVRPGAPVECWGPESSALLESLLPAGERVRAAYQPGGRRDQYDRELWDVWLPDGRFLQAVLVRRGAAEATPYEPQVAHAAFLAALERRARAHRRGMFGACPS